MSIITHVGLIFVMVQFECKDNKFPYILYKGVRKKIKNLLHHANFFARKFERSDHILIFRAETQRNLRFITTTDETDKYLQKHQ